MKVRSKGGRAKVVGTKVADIFDIVMDDLGQITVTPGSGTTVNGGTEPVTVDASKSLTVKAGDGDDTVTVTGAGDATKASKIVLDGGKGADDLAVESVAVQKFAVKCGGASVVDLESVDADTVSVKQSRKSDATFGVRISSAGRKFQYGGPGARIVCKTPKDDAGPAFEGGMVIDLTIEQRNALIQEAILSTGKIQVDDADQVTCQDVDAKDLDVRVRQRDLTKEEFHTQMDLVRASFQESFKATLEAEQAALRLEEAEIERNLQIELAKVGNATIDFVNATFGTDFQKRALCGNRRAPNVTVTETGTRLEGGAPVDIPSVVNDLKGVILPAKR